MLLYKYKIQPVYCCCPCFKLKRMYTWAIKLKSNQVKGLCQVKKHEVLKIKQPLCWIQSDDAETCVVHRKHPGTFPNKAFLVPIFPKGSEHTYATNSLPMEKRSAKCFIHSHMLYLFIFQQKWHIEYVCLEIPEIHSLGFQPVPHSAPIPSNLSPRPLHNQMP